MQEDPSTQIPTNPTTAADARGVIRNDFLPGDQVVVLARLIPQKNAPNMLAGSTSCGRYLYWDEAPRKVIRDKKTYINVDMADLKRICGFRGYAYLNGRCLENGLMYVDTNQRLPEPGWKGPKVYVGVIDQGEHLIQVARRDGPVGVLEAGQPIDVRYDLCQHSPTGLSWGYAGSGPAQASLAILCDALQAIEIFDTQGSRLSTDETAGRLYQDFKFEVIGKLDMGKGFELSQADVLKWFRKKHGDWRPGYERRKVCPHGNAWGKCMASNCVPF